MQKHPKVSLKIDIERDINNCINFLRSEKKGNKRQFLLWFLPDDFQYILNKKFSTRERNKIIKEYTRRVYRTKKDKIRDGLNKAKKDWKIIAKGYFELVDKIFDGHSWPKGNYRGIASIYKMYPRYLEHKIFFFPCIHRISASKVIAHEMLHFIFFDYLEKHFGLKEHSKIKGKPDDYIWKVSEVFNNVIENWRPYRQIIKTKPRPYPGTEKMFKKMSKQWRKQQDINWLLKQWFDK